MNIFNPNDYKPLGSEDTSTKEPGFFNRDNPNDALFDFNEDFADDDAADTSLDDDKNNPPAKKEEVKKPAAKKEEDEEEDDDEQDIIDKSKGLSFDDLDEDEEEEGEESDSDAEEEEEDSKKSKKATGLSKVFKKLLEDEILLPFDEDKDLDSYTQKDFVELISANFDSRKEDIRKEVTNEFYESLPEELQTAMTYVANGGANLQGLFKQLGTTVELKNLNPEKDSETIVRKYLQETNFGDTDLINEQIIEWRESGVLAKKAKRFHPTLVQKHNDANKEAIRKAEELKQDRQRLGTEFQESMLTVLEKKDLNGIPLTKELRNSLAEGILTSSHQSKLANTKTNELFYLIEKYQTEDKKPDLIAEALLLLRDPDVYREAVSKRAVRESDKDRVLKMKSSNEKRKAGGASSFEEQPDAKRVRKNVSRKPAGFFKR